MATRREAVFVARNSAEETEAERILKGQRIDFEVTLEAGGKPEGAVCYLSMVYKVPAEDAPRARAALAAYGLATGIVPARSA